MESSNDSKSLGTHRGGPSYIPANTFALALFDALLPASGGPSALDNVRVQVSKLPPYSARDILLQMIDQANGSLQIARTGVENWFNSAMDRVSGEYRRRIIQVTLLVSLLVTSIFGVDSIALANSLWMEPGLRAAISGAATGFKPLIQWQPVACKTR